MPSRLKQLLQLLEEAKIKGDTDQVGILEQELFTMKDKKQEGGEIKVKGGGYINDLL
jgi:hypothetical protein